MSSLFFTKAAAARILPFATRIEAVRVFKGAIQVTYLIKNGRCSTFLSKTSFYQDFAVFRQESAKNCTVRRWGAGSFTHHYECFSAKSERIYTVKLVAGLALCECLNYKEQDRQLGKAKPGCKHVLATLNHVGYGSLAEYMDAMVAKARGDLFGDEPMQPVPPTQNEIAAISAALATPTFRKTKPAPEPFGGFGFA
jgi:hypothetical protein